MAQYIYNDFSEFKAEIGKGISQSVSFDELGPTILNAAEKHLIPWIGVELWDDLVANIATPGIARGALLPYLRRPLALLTMYEYVLIGEVQVNDSGIVRLETEDIKTAYKSQVNNYREYMLINGYNAIEPLLRFLESNSADYPLWTASDESTRNREAFINTVRDFRLAYNTQMSRFVMETMRGIMLDVEEVAIRPLFGDDFYEEIKTAINDKTETADQKTLISKVRKAVAYFTVQEGIRQKIVANTGQAIVVRELLEPQSNVREGSPSSDKLRLAIQHHDEFGNRHISIIKKYLDSNRDTFPTYKTYIEAIEEAEAAAIEEETIVDDCGNVIEPQKSIIKF